MKRMLTAITFAALLAAPALGLTAQQEKMKACNAEATQKALKGDARKTFMSDCLKADHGGLTPQQQKMKDCNASANTQHLKGESRKEFMSSCLAK